MSSGFSMAEMRLPKMKDLFLVKKFSYSVSIGGASNKNITRANLNFEIPEGYKIFSIVQFKTGNNYITVEKIDLTEKTNLVRAGNQLDSSATLKFELYVAFIKEEYADGFWYDAVENELVAKPKIKFSANNVPIVLDSVYRLESITIPLNGTFERIATTDRTFTIKGNPGESVTLQRTGYVGLTANYVHQDDETNTRSQAYIINGLSGYDSIDTNNYIMTFGEFLSKKNVYISVR